MITQQQDQRMNEYMYILTDSLSMVDEYDSECTVYSACRWGALPLTLVDDVFNVVGDGGLYNWVSHTSDWDDDAIGVVINAIAFTEPHPSVMS